MKETSKLPSEIETENLIDDVEAVKNDSDDELVTAPEIIVTGKQIGRAHV